MIMHRIKPKALLICGIIATSPNASCTIRVLTSRTHIKGPELRTLLRAMQDMGMVKRNSVLGYADEYSLRNFQCEISDAPHLE